MHKAIGLILLCLAGVLAAAPLRLFVTIAPQREIVQRIAGTEAHVTVLVPPGMSPESFSPDARTLNALSKADLFFTIGISCEDALLPKLRHLNRSLRVIAPAARLSVRDFAPPGIGRDPHLWLDAGNIMVMAQQVADALSDARPAESDGFAGRAQDYCRHIREIDRQLSELLRPLRGKSILVYHPAFAYFLERYGMRQLPIELEGKEPPGGYLGRVIRQAKAEKCPVLFVQPQVNERAVEAIAGELGCRTAVLDPLPQDISGGLLEMGRTISQAYDGKAGLQ